MSVSSVSLDTAITAVRSPARTRARTTLPIYVILLVLLFAIARSGLYTARSEIGYWLGVAGGSAMLLLLLYPLSKRVPGLRALLPAYYWFAGHMLLGVLGPILILLHCTFRIGSTNAAVALWSMLIVAASGVVGRFVYGRLHSGMYGRQRSFSEVARSAEALFIDAGAQLRQAPAVIAELRRFAEFAHRVASAGLRRPLGLISIEFAARDCARACRRMLDVAVGDEAASVRTAEGVNRVVHEYLRTARDAAQFRAFERAFALWHVLHIPLLALLAVTAVFHVLAVHMY